MHVMWTCKIHYHKITLLPTYVHVLSDLVHNLSTSSLSSSEKVTATCKTGIRKHQTSLAIKGEIRLKNCHLDHQPKFLSLNSPHPFYCNSGLCEHQDRTTLTALKIFLVVAALHFCPSLGAKYNCTQKYQKLLREAGVVKAQCPNAALHDCCQVGVCKEVTTRPLEFFVLIGS